ncbi:Mucin-19 [Microtus ochrogaster]|uniref:Mucin-19 n=1 Tax=Microtus ochrogaster TaxID=79684 RepID=A0A8J6FXX8_MICOH|nr:Mucin-19 [Microtus ochrogaster]
MKLILLYVAVVLCTFCKASGFQAGARYFLRTKPGLKVEVGMKSKAKSADGGKHQNTTAGGASSQDSSLRTADDVSSDSRDGQSESKEGAASVENEQSIESSRGSSVGGSVEYGFQSDLGETFTWGNGKYKALKGRIFSFESSCAYTFCRDCAESGGDFNIEIKRDKKNKIEEIRALIDDVGISVLNNTIFVKEERIQVPYTNKMIHIKKQGDHYVLNSRRKTLSLRWSKNKLSLTLYSQYTTCGLCGNFNNTPGEDINEHIANSKISSDCPSAYCDKIIGAYFEDCGKVSPLSSEYRQVCVDEYCQTGGGKDSTCDTFSELARLCAYDGPGVFEHWRDDSAVVCEKQQCPGKHIYKECGPSNPPTCSNVAPFQDSECVSGCTCPEGYLLDDIGDKGKCVLREKCPCESNGKVYKPGEVREGSCGSQCTCQDAKWSCTKALCPGICKVEGSLITTFDDNVFNHPGDCYFLALHNEEISVSVELRPCDDGQTGSCLKSVTLLRNSSVSGGRFVFNSDGTVTKDGVVIQGYYYSDEIQIFNASSLYMQAEVLSLLKMQIQIAPAMQLYLSMRPDAFTDTVGLCGSYNNKAEDDFMSSQKILESTAQAFANSWEMMSCSKGSPSSCVSIEAEKFADSNCGILLNSSGPFADCHQTVSPKFYYEECKKYTCSCGSSQDCLCTILGNYVKACAEKKTYLEGWRDGLCELSCPSGLVFDYKVKTCNSSCRSLSQHDRSCDIEDIPVDGCTCPEGTYQNSEGSCVQMSECDCYVNDEIVQPGKSILIDDNNCTCIKGSWNCTQHECQSTCHIYGEGHVRTFDGESYSFDGLCQYTFLEDQNIILQDGKVTAVQTTENKDCELNGTLYSIHTVGLYLIVKLPNGIILIWDKYTKVSVILDPRWQVDPTAYYNACIEEACACDMEGKYLGFCTAVAMYAEACNAAGVCVSWRKPNLCPVYCDYYNGPGECSWHYEPCGTVTAKTCKDQVIGQKFSSLLEGCYARCPESAPYLDENTMKCVQLSECSCYYNDVIPAGGAVVDE